MDNQRLVLPDGTQGTLLGHVVVCHHQDNTGEVSVQIMHEGHSMSIRGNGAVLSRTLRMAGELIDKGVEGSLKIEKLP